MMRALGSSLALVVLFTASPAAAQSDCYKGQCDGLQVDAIGSNYDQVTIGRGYAAPPDQFEGVAGGEIDASYLGRTREGPCRGFATALPDHQIVLTERATNVELSVRSRADTLLLVHGPDGWRCNDDTNGSHPRLRGQLGAGTYRVWVATYDGTYAPYRLSLDAERPEPRPRDPVDPPPQSSLDTEGTDAIYDVTRLGPSELAAGAEFDGRPGGTIDLESLGRTRTGPCDGFAGERPHHILHIDEEPGLLAFTVESDVDTTLAVLGPDGWSCNDDDTNINPGVADRLPAGTYRVWVGTYRLRDVGRYRLVVSDLRAPEPEEPVAEPEVLRVVGSFEGSDVSFSGYTTDDVRADCMAHVNTVRGLDWVDDVVLNGRSYRNTFSYWSPPQLCSLVAASVTSENAAFYAEGTIEDTPFRFGADTPEEIRAQCQTFLSAFPDMWLDDLTVNGSTRRNDFGYWSQTEACMTISTLAQPR